MKKIHYITLTVLLIFLFSLPVLSGCGKVAQWADPMVENVLVSVNNEDYTGFIKDFDQALINEIPQEKFPEVISLTTGLFGKYVEGSLRMNAFNIVNNETTAEYEGKFENKDSVKFKFVFEKNNDQTKITGLAFE